MNLIISLIAFLVHFPFGFLRSRYRKLSRPWSRCLYIPIVLNILARRFILHWDWKTAMIYLWPAVLIAHILGGYIGARFNHSANVKTHQEITKV